LKKLLSPDGQIVLVVDLGLNTQFEMSLRTKTIEFDKQGYLRHPKGYRWQEADWKDVKDVKYDKSIPTANAVMVGVIHQKNNEIHDR
jgi:hypothetical protein